MLTLPAAAEPLLTRFSIAFTKPTFQRAMLLFVGFVLTLGRRTVTGALWTTRNLWRGHCRCWWRCIEQRKPTSRKPGGTKPRANWPGR